MAHPELLIFFALIAFIYASVGFGGGSSYLAILALYALPVKEIRLTALICNIIVVSSGSIIFIINRQVNWKKIMPIALASVPMAYLGASLKLTDQVFFIILGFSLLIAGAILWMRIRVMPVLTTPGETHYARDSLIGGLIGFLSGMVGIGGGIFLSPLLNIMKWDSPKRIAATASFFILVNSVAGMAGLLMHTHSKIDHIPVLMLAVSVLAGGLLGARMAMLKFDQLIVRRLTAVLVLVAGMEVLYKHLF